MITLTPNAISAVDRFIKGAATPVAGLRIAISGGGCSGFQYGMSLEEAKQEDDTVLEYGAVILKKFPEIDINTCTVGIFGKVAELDGTLKPGDRIEIYRAITADPATVPRRVIAGDDE